jgi:hypothetical protein
VLGSFSDLCVPPLPLFGFAFYEMLRLNVKALKAADVYVLV